MSNATRVKLLPPPSSYAVRERARRAEAECVADRAARAHAGRCDCGLPATHGELCAACNTAHKESLAEMNTRLDAELAALLASVPEQPGHAVGLANLHVELDERGDFDGLDGFDAEEVL